MWLASAVLFAATRAVFPIAMRNRRCRAAGRCSDAGLGRFGRHLVRWADLCSPLAYALRKIPLYARYLVVDSTSGCAPSAIRRDLRRNADELCLVLAPLTNDRIKLRRSHRANSFSTTGKIKQPIDGNQRCLWKLAWMPSLPRGDESGAGGDGRKLRVCDQILDADHRAQKLEKTRSN